MLDINPEIVCGIIEKSREFQAKEEVVIPEDPHSPGDDWALQVLADHIGDLTYVEVSNLITDLEPIQQVTLVALMWLGRGDFELDEWESAMEQAKDSWTERTAEYLLATPLVSDFLTDGLDQLGHSCNE
ncbi:MAG: DUF3775 domain-containing protein [Gammaproteobacteria bacterium]|nr:MAG: DUF3775 domain-containing protein [Gammaproteobacteria bacterium]